ISRPRTWSVCGARLNAVESLERRVLLSGVTYYVSVAGGSGGNRGTAAAPFATLRKAADTVGAGDTVVARAGSYAGFSMGWATAATGTAGAPITFAADPAAAAGSVVITGRNRDTPDGVD